MSSAYTRKTGKLALIPRRAGVPFRSSHAVESYGISTLVAVPVSKVLRPIECDVCRETQERGAFVLREWRMDYFTTTCLRCAKPVSATDLWAADTTEAG